MRTAEASVPHPAATAASRSTCSSDLSGVEVDEAVGLVAELHASVAQRLVPVTDAGRVSALRPVVARQQDRSLLEQAHAIEMVEEDPEPAISILHRRDGDRRVRAALVMSGVRQQRVPPH